MCVSSSSSTSTTALRTGSSCTSSSTPFITLLSQLFTLAFDTTSSGTNMKIGRCRDRNLLLPPFDLPNPLVIYPDTDGQRDKFIGLWALPFTDWRRGGR